MIRDYELAKYKVPEEILPKDRYMIKDTWTRFNGMSYYKMYLIRDIEKSLGMTLVLYREQQMKLSKEHKDKIITDMTGNAFVASWETVSRICPVFRFEDFPSAAAVERIVFTGLGHSSFPSYKYRTTHFADELDRAHSIRTRQAYEDWIAWLKDPVNAEVIRVKLCVQDYDLFKVYKTHDLTNKLHAHMYFRTAEVALVLPEFVERNHLNDTKEALDKDMKKYSLKINKFCKDNALDKCAFMFDETSVRVANNLLRYPNKGPPDSIAEFMRQYLVQEDIYDVSQAKIESVRTWPECIAFLKKTKIKFYAKYMPERMVVFMP